MKSWLGVIGRACLEFVILLILLSFAAGASSSVGLPDDSLRPMYIYAAWAALGMTPLAALLTIFLAFFSFELRQRSRVMGWLGLFALGALLFSVGIGMRRAPVVRDVIAQPKLSFSALRLIPPGVAIQNERTAVWVGGYNGSEASDAVAVDFGSDYPRLAYSPRAPLSWKAGEVEIQGRSYSVARAEPPRIHLVPESSVFAGSWIWDRLSSMDDEPVYVVFAAAGGFLLLAIGFRFLCRITGWPLANVFLAAAGMAGLSALDAALSGPGPLAALDLLAKGFGVPLSGPVLLAAVEGVVGLLLGLIDIAAGVRAGRGSDA